MKTSLTGKIRNRKLQVGLVEDPTRNNVERKRNSIRMIEVKTDSMTKIVQGRYDSAREA